MRKRINTFNKLILKRYLNEDKYKKSKKYGIIRIQVLTS